MLRAFLGWFWLRMALDRIGVQLFCGEVYTLSVEERSYSSLDFISYGSNFIDGLALGIAEGPIFAAKSWDAGALVAAAHGDEEFCVLP